MTEDYEEFDEKQLKILNRYVTNTHSNVFALKNLPEVIKGALFSRYSRSGLGLRSLLLKDFVSNDETLFAEIAGCAKEEKEDSNEQVLAIQKAQNFYDRILDGYGDDSIGELGGAHIAVENISMLAAKAIEDARIGGSPLEKSTRYIYFDQKLHGEYFFYREPVIMTSAFKDIYIETCNHLFETYSRLIPMLTEVMEKKCPKDPEVSKPAYTAAIRAKVLDCLRGLLPAGTMTNMGLFGNGRFYENLLQKLGCENLSELQDLAKKGYDELHKVIPSFVRRAEPSHRHFQFFQDYRETLSENLKKYAKKHGSILPKEGSYAVRLIDTNADAKEKVAAALLFANTGASLSDIQDHMKKLPSEEIGAILQAAVEGRKNRRHKSPRALEHAWFTFEIVADFGIYRDLHRHRTLTQERQLLTCNHGYFVPEDIINTPMEKPYRQALDKARDTYKKIAGELPEEAQYVVPMAYNVRWYFHINLRALQWLTELRSSPQGHPAYREVAQSMAHQAFAAHPEFKRFFEFVDFEGYTVGRLDQEIRNEQKQKERLAKLTSAGENE